MKNSSFEKYVILYIPWLLAWVLKDNPITSYTIAWLGSFFIFYITFSGKIKPMPADRSFAEQLMRPIFLAHIIFAGYMSCTSIFYFFNVLGYEDFRKISEYYLINNEKLQLTAQCQRYYCLAHAAFVSGILVFMKYPVEKKFYIGKDHLANLLMMNAIISFPASILFTYIPGLSQFYYQFSSLSFIAGTLALAFAIPLQKLWNTLICLCLYLFNFYLALTSGFKEPIIISVLVLGVFLYPNYKRVVTFTFIPMLFALFVFLPAYNEVFRQNAWSGDTSSDDATQLALDAALSNNSPAHESNWNFLAFRLSEIDMFTMFASSTPDKIDFYGVKLVEQSLIAIVPRVFWPSKPSTEELIMERVYDAGVIFRASSVSAKPAFVVDAYLSGGGLGVFICLFIYGASSQLIALKAEKLFGGYILGTALVFSGLFQIFWRGLSFEFIINSVFWSYVTMLLLSKLLVTLRVLKEV
ncbi:MAG: hypothetical protein EOP47_21160 [Sphingobacteriaceae bacterium]|nr:MAG: hypothetical protein EOP47_21160 [Sphingobacteriaceae bacterium]